jgi:hypothetical protein
VIFDCATSAKFATNVSCTLCFVRRLEKKQRKKMTNMKATDVTTETTPGMDEWRKHLLSDCVRNGPLPGLIAARFSDSRSYLRRLRAAEMAAWEFSGGDCLLSKCANHVHAR